MPNLDYDPRNPSDLLGRRVKPGDLVAWGTTYGRSAALCVGRIERFNFTRLKPEYKTRSLSNSGYDGYSADCYEPADQATADRYTITLEPIKSTGSTTFLKDDGEEYHEYRDGSPERLNLHAKLKTFSHVKNIVLLEAL